MANTRMPVLGRGVYSDGEFLDKSWHGDVKYLGQSAHSNHRDTSALLGQTAANLNLVRFRRDWPGGKQISQPILVKIGA
jgi:hypothetical protein